MLGHLGLSDSAVGADGTTLTALADGILAYPGVTVASFGRALLNALNTNTFTGTDQLSVAAAAAKTAYGVNTTTGAAGATLKTAVDVALGVTPTTPTNLSKNFATGSDSLVGGDGNDTFSGSILSNSSSTSDVANGDKVDGGAGTDTVAITAVDPQGTALSLNLLNVERITVEQYSAMSLSGAAWDSSVNSITSTGLADTDLTVTNLRSTPSFTLTNPNLGADAPDKDLTVTYLNLTGTADSASIALNYTSGSNIDLSRAGNVGVLETVTVSLTQSGTGAPVTIDGLAISGTTALTFTANGGDRASITVTPAIGNVTVDGTASATTVTLSGGFTAARTITLSGGDDTFTANGTGFAGNVTLNSGTGKDTITLNNSGTGNVNATLGLGNDSISFNMIGAHTIDGGDGNDSITASTNSGDLTLNAGSGNDTLTITMSGAHNINMGAGADTIVGSSFINANDTVDGGADADRLSLTIAGTTSLSPNISNVETLDVNFNASSEGGRRLNLTNVNGYSTIEVDGSANNVVTVTGLSGAVTLYHTDGLAGGTNTVAFKDSVNGTLTITGAGSGGAANNTSYNLDEIQTLVVNTNANRANEGFSGVTVNVDPTDTTSITINSSSGTHSITLGDYTTAVTTLALSHSGNGTTTIALNGSEQGLAGTVTLSATQSGTLAITGLDAGGAGSGVTTYALTATVDGDITIDNMSGNNLYGGPSISATIGQSGTVFIDDFRYSNLEGATLSITSSGSGGNFLRFGSAVGAIADFYSSVSISGSDLRLLMGASGTTSENTVLASQSDSMVISTASGADYILGGTAADSIIAGAGDDTAFGGGGDDTINAGAGTDIIYGGGGNDSITGGSGVQTVYAGSGADVISTGSGADVIYFSEGADTITGGAGDRFVWIAGSAVTTTQVTFSAFSTSSAVFDVSGTVAPATSYSDSNNGLSLSTGGTAVSKLFGSSAGYDVHYVTYWGTTGALISSTLDFKSTSAFAMLVGTSSNGVDSIFTGTLSADFGSAAAADGIRWDTGASGGVAVVAITTGSGAGAGTYLVTLGAQGSGTITLSTANVISQVFLSGFTGTLSAGNFD